MNIVEVFDDSKYRLGSLCKRGHDWNGTGQSLRRLRRQGTEIANCVQCGHERSARTFRAETEARHAGAKYLPMCSCQKCVAARRLDEQEKTAIAPPFDQALYKLGGICKKSHNYCNTGKSLRYIASRECIICSKAKQKRNYHGSREIKLQKKKVYYKQNYERERRRAKAYKQANPEKTRIHHRRKEFKRRSLIEHGHRVPYSAQDVAQRFEQFDRRCAYCGDENDLTMDHFIPINKGGGDTIGNIIPACRKCNSSKNNKMPIDWYPEQSFYSKLKWRKILKALGKTESSSDQLSLL